MKALIEGGWVYKTANDEKKGDESGGDEEFDDEKAENKMVQTILDKANVSPNETNNYLENRAAKTCIINVAASTRFSGQIFYTKIHSEPLISLS
jgi:hypothetical protein